MLTAKEIRLILIAPAIISIIVLSGCFHKKEPDKKSTEEAVKTEETEGMKKSVIEIEETEEEEEE